MHEFLVDSLWFQGKADIHVYQIEELLGTKVRALYQRRKGRDLFDLVTSHNSSLSLNWDSIIECFNVYMEKEGKRITRAEFEENMHYKLQDPFFLNDLTPLLASTFSQKYDPKIGAELLNTQVFPRLSGESWKMIEASEKPA